MSGVWSAVLNLDLTIPSNGKLIPGSSTVYIGGPRLPTELKTAKAKGAVVFYSSATDPTAKYYYLAYIDTSGVGLGYAITVGYCDTSGNLHSPLYASSDSVNGFTQLLGPDTSAFPPTVTLSNAGVYTEALDGIVQVRSNVIDFLAGFGSNPQKISFRNLSGPSKQPCLKADTTLSVLDQWFTSTTLQTVGGQTNCTVIFDWRMTPDYICEVRIRCTAATPPWPGAFALNVTAPAACPKPDSGPGTGSLINAWGNVGAYNGAQVVPLTGRFNATGIVDIFSQGIGTLRDFSGAFVFTKAKP